MFEIVLKVLELKVFRSLLSFKTFPSFNKFMLSFRTFTSINKTDLVQILVIKRAKKEIIFSSANKMVLEVAAGLVLMALS